MKIRQAGYGVIASSIFATTFALAQSNEIRVTVPNQTFESIAKMKDQKAKEYKFQGVEVKINGEPWVPGKLEIRGQSCLIAERKCFDLKIKSPNDGQAADDETSVKIDLRGQGGVSAKQFNLVSMWQDKGYISSKIGFEMFRVLGIFDFRTEYAEVFLNEKSMGLYLVTEKPAKGVKRAVKKGKGKEVKAEFFFARRNMSGSIEDKSDFSPESGLKSAPFLSAYSELRAAISTRSGAKLLATLESKMNLKRYMQWLIVNSVLKNGDYSDEVYIYADASRGSIYFDIFPWDFDDIFKEPHPTPKNEQHKKDIATTLLYSFENPLDEKIGTDPVLYAKLQEVARELLSRITDQALEQVVGNVHTSISPYLTNTRALEPARLDSNAASGRKPYSAGQIESILKARLKELKDRRDLLKTRI